MSETEYAPADEWYKGYYINRKNRFVMELEVEGEKIEAYVPNTGRMTEFRFSGWPFYVTPTNTGKLDFRLISSYYQDSLVWLDTIKVNDIFHRLLRLGNVPEFEKTVEIEREVSFGNSRFDFLLTTDNDEKILVEIKSCTLCHNKLALFPDAPTARGRKHINHLERLSDQYKTYVYFLALTGNAEAFLPNFHIDYKYGRIFQQTENVNYKAIKLNLLDPGTVDLNSVEKLTIDNNLLTANCTKSGSYLLLLQNEQEQSIEIGSLGKITFQSGYYVYIGSAMTNLDKRVKRHYRKRKKQHWHIDYLTKGKMEVIEDYKIRRYDRIEEKVAGQISQIAENNIDGFGSSDSDRDSHLFYFKTNPARSKKFYSLVLDMRTSLMG